MKKVTGNKRKGFIIGLIMICSAVVFSPFLMKEKNDNRKQWEEWMENPQMLLNGVYEVVKTSEDMKAAGNAFKEGQEDNDYEKLLEIQLKGRTEMLNASYSMQEIVDGQLNRYHSWYTWNHTKKYDDVIGKRIGDKDIWYCCRYKAGTKEVLLYDDKNECIGSFGYEIGDENWWGKRKVQYYLKTEQGQTEYVRISDSFMLDPGEKSYLKSRYYTGEIEI